ncbi:hypothetical protein [Actinomycetospora straminea]|uniref:Uncharacterized protein n=1 Tax=Actinomycetospora straminea TaxID=663607 RepID=A0ABP9E0Q2_9PSEU|nr:hypothetical protein [Actinomycetospora straminea]MDD7930958.1 hypothetical protein [Actinomycetospora straminea]
MEIVLGIVAVLAVVLTVVVARRDRPGPLPGPRLAPDLAATILLRAGFPATAHNVLAVQEHLGALFLERGREALDAARWSQVVAACEAGRAGMRPDLAGWPQYVLDQVASATGGTVAAGLARRCQDLLLASVGTGRGLFGGSLFEPLPRLRPAVRTA